MPWNLLPTNYTNASWSGLKRYNLIDNGDGTISLQDMTVYTGRETSFFGALEANRMNEALNTLMSMVEQGSDLYGAFQNYFNTQKTLFHNQADADYQEFVQYLTDLETEGFESLTGIANRAAESERNAKASETNAAASEAAARASETAARTSEINAGNSENIASQARHLAEAAETGATTAKGQSEEYARQARESFLDTQAVAIRTPYIGNNGNWFVWDNAHTAYVDSGFKAQGVPGAQGEQGVQGVPGEQGINGVALAADGIWAFNVDENGHLIVHYTGDTAPNLSLNQEDGHLYLTI